MANSDQLISLIKSHIEGDDARFCSLALQVSVSEAKLGHAVIARTIKEILDKHKFKINPIKLHSINNDVAEFVTEQDTTYTFGDMVISSTLESQIKRVIKEYIQKDKLLEFGLENRKRILLEGPSGTGKTMTASVIANELHLPLFVVRMEKIVTKFMGETGLKISKVFDMMSTVPGIYLFDEFDAIGQRRGQENEVGEMRRILTTFLQLLERDTSDSIVLATTNSPGSLDKALFRRFDDILHYEHPTQNETIRLIQQCFCKVKFQGDVDALANNFQNHSFSQAEICLICKDAIKTALLNDEVLLNNELIKNIINERIQFKTIG